MKQATLIKKQTIEFSETEVTNPAENEIQLKVLNIGICGSDIHAYHGKHPFMSFPIRLGHEMSGEIVQLGSGVVGYNIGELVTMMPQEFCDDCEPCNKGRYNICNTLQVIGCQTPGACCEFLNVDASLIKKIPANIDSRTAAVVEPVAVGVHNVRRTGSVVGMNVVVLGAGTIGNVTAQAAMAEGAKSVLITDIVDYRLEVAKRCNIPNVANTSKISMKQAIADAFGEEGADLFVECIGVGGAVNQAIEFSKKGNDIVVAGVFGYTPEINMALIQDKELRISGSLMYVDKDFQSAIDYLADGKINMNPLISKEFSFEELGDAFKYIDNNKETMLKVVITL